MIICLFLTTTSCVYFNTFYNANQKFRAAEKNQRGIRLQHQQKDTTIPNRAAKPVEPTVSVNDKTLYKEAIDKANKVALYHPDSKYADDALWLIGKARYNINEFVACDKSLKELVVNFPKSKFVGDAYFYMGMSQFWLDKHDLAYESFNHIKDMKKSPYKDDALFVMAYIDYLDKNFASALSSFANMVAEYPNSDSAGAAQFFVAVCYDSLGQYQEALQAYKDVDKYRRSYDLDFDARYAYGSAALKADSISLGMSVFNSLAKDERFFDRSSLIRLKLAEGKNLMGNTGDAVTEYLGVVEQYPQTEQAAEAYYRLGMLYQDDLDSLEKAKEHFNKATQEKRDSKFRNLALARAAQITKLETYKSRLGLDKAPKPPSSPAADSSAVPDSGASAVQDSILPQQIAANNSDSLARPNTLGPIFQEMLRDANEMGPPAPEIGRNDSSLVVGPDYQNIDIPPVMEPVQVVSDTSAIAGTDSSSANSEDTEIRFMLAELYHHDLNRPDSALHEYLLLADNYPGSPYAPKALLASAFIYEGKGDTAEAREIYQRLIDSYPSSSQAQYAVNEIEGASIPFEQNVALLYKQAEDQYFIQNDPVAAMELFKSIQTGFPTSDYAAKSAYASAWIMRNTHREEGDSSAYLAYQNVVEKYPETVYADKAKMEMGLVKKDKPESNKKKNTDQNKSPQPDSSGLAKADSLQQYAGTLPPAPPVKDSAEFLYPVQLLNEGHKEKGKVTFKVKADLFGNVVDYQLLGPSGNSLIDSVATQALLRTVFDTSNLADLSLLNEYFRYDIKFEPPRDWEDRFDHADPYDPYHDQ